MNITLRKANAIQTSIQDTIRSISIDGTITINEFQEPKLLVAEAHRKMIEDDRRRAMLLTVLYNIRGLVSQANHESGINLLLTKSALADKRIQQVEELARFKVATDMEVIEGRIAKIKNTKEDHRLYGRDEVSTGIVDQSDIEKFKRELKEIRKTKQKYNDEILELNIKTEIPLNEEAIKILTSEGIL
jgi:hypothetical protein